MSTALSHRGPDGKGRYEWGGVGLIHTRLSIIDLQGGGQPLYSEDASIALVCNGEIYNYVELREELEALGHRFATGSDSETLIHAYESWGLGFLDRLHGMFAFALFDAKSRQLLVARDRLGIKPLFLLRATGAIYFASELKALLGVLNTRPVVNPHALLQYMQNQYISGNDTLLRDITRVQPGEAVLIDENGAKHWRYYTLPVEERHRMSVPQLVDRFDALMSDVIREHIRSDVPFGLFLSGGVDSSLLAQLLQRHGNTQLQTFSVGFLGDNSEGELSQARELARDLGTDHTELVLQPAELLERLPFAVWGADELLADSACLPTSFLSERAGRQLKVVFNGEGGDEVFAGYARYRASSMKRLLRRIRAPGLGGMRASGHCNGYEREIFGEQLTSLGNAWQAPQAQAWRAYRTAGTDVRRMQAVDIATWLPDDLLVKCDRMLMAFALEGRVPYLDHRVVAFGLALDDREKVDQYRGKIFLRHWGERYLAGPRLWTPKKGFTVPIEKCFTHSVLESLEVLLPGSAAIREWFRAEGTRRLVQNVRAGRGGHQVLWRLLQFAIWHGIFVENGGRRPALNTTKLDLAL